MSKGEEMSDAVDCVAETSRLSRSFRSRLVLLSAQLLRSAASGARSKQLQTIDGSP
jgi:hypothetical protein